MSRKIFLGISAVLLTLGLCSVAFAAGDPDRTSEAFAFDSGMTGQNMQGGMNVATHDNMSSQTTTNQDMQEQKSAPCVVAIEKATENATVVSDLTGDCRRQYQDIYGGNT